MSLRSCLHLFICIFSLLGPYVLLAQTFPERPVTTSVITCLPDTTGYFSITVGPQGRDYEDLQEAIDAAFPGTVIYVDPGVNYEGGFVLRDKGASDQWIIITSSKMELLPDANERIQPFAQTGDPVYATQHQAMPQLITTNLAGIPCIKTDARAHHYWLMGLEITADINVIESYGLINLGASGATQNTLDKVPHHLVLDRCYIHGHTEGTIMKYGVRLDCADGAILGCHISDFHSIGFDAQAISCINGPGPFKIINNYLEASGENILIGGGTPGIQGLVPADMEILQNHLYKPWAWRVGHPDYAGKHWTIKNHFELKTGQRILFEGNVLENCWADLPIGQSGYSILLTVRTEGGNYPQANVSDVMIRNNIIRHVGAGITLSGSDGANSIRSERIMISNNLFEDINGPGYGDLLISGPNDGTFLKIGNPADVIVDHNTILQTGPVTWAYNVTEGFVFTRNIVQSFVSAGGYRGIYGPGQMEGNHTLAEYFPDITDQNRHFHENVFIAGNASKYDQFQGASQNYFPADIGSVGFVDFDSGPVDYHGYELDPLSTYYLICEDGLSPGADFGMLDSAFQKHSECESIGTGIHEESSIDASIDLYPNPSTGLVYINSDQGDVIACHCYDASGRLIKSAHPGLASFSLDMTGFAGGLYTIQVYLGDRMICHRIVLR